MIDLIKDGRTSMVFGRVAKSKKNDHGRYLEGIGQEIVDLVKD